MDRPVDVYLRITALRTNPIIELDERQGMRAVECGIARQNESLRSNRKDNHGAPKDPLDGLLLHINGAAGEQVAGIVVDIPWTAHVNTFKGPDLGNDTQTRNRTQRVYGQESAELMVRTNDNPDHWYIMTVGSINFVESPTHSNLDSFHLKGVRPSKFEVMGFIRGRDAMRAEWWGTPNSREPAWWVLPHHLRPICEFNEAAHTYCLEYCARIEAEEAELYHRLGL